ncbi:hypothetical protein MIND_00513800 [Mycena indigotica]|uniref:Uncharacterized protein n=1 Tax=Mycena indigotica TaxID=2126181 RepID=A0A8H6W709_9AGAR|nr:uncharacterized protein MIND_00513800 [Mycena indigotica]KAF7307202.1 hypothetical protein MIND_00513800 [Mycena indigotica]
MPLSLQVVASTSVSSPFWDIYAEDFEPNARAQLEWCWGLPLGSLDSHLSSFTDPAMEALLEDDSSLIAIHPSLVSALLVQFRRKRRQPPHIDGLYNGRKMFDYIVLDANKAATIPPRLISSSIPPHLTLGPTSTKLSKNMFTSSRGREKRIRALFELPNACQPWPGITVDHLHPYFTCIDYTFKQWLIATVPPDFLAGFDAQLPPSDAADGSPPRFLIPYEPAR